MTDYERTVLDHYQLPTSNPYTWPAEKDLSSASEDEDPNPKRNTVSRKSKARFSALERTASDRRSLPGSQRTGDGVENLVQRDEADPLGSTDSVMRVLRQRGIRVEDNAQIRNKYLLSSTTFSPASFLSQVHSTASTQELLRGLDILSRSIDQKSASLKLLVESNFERFVRAKATIDNVYTEMKYQGAPPPAPASPQYAHSRHASRNSFRASSGNQQAMMIGSTEIRKKTALMKESEYGVSGIKGPLLDVSAKVEELWGPAMGGQAKQGTLTVMSETVEEYKDMYKVSAGIADGIKRKNYESVAEEYGKAKRFTDSARQMVRSIGSNSPSESQIHQILLAARIEADVKDQIDTFQRDVWRRLDLTHINSSKATNVATTNQDQHIELISFLLEVDTEASPILIWLSGRYSYLEEKIQSVSDRSRAEIEIARRRLASLDRPSPQVIASHMRSLGRNENSISKDSADTLELWEMMEFYLNSLLSPQGILGEVIEFWRAVQSFIDGSAQKNLPVGYNGQARRHHQLDAKQINEYRTGTATLLDLIRENIFSFFADPPIEDISALLSPLPQTPNTPAGAFQSQQTPTALLNPNHNFDLNNLPPPSPKLGEAWEKFAFWPPWSNSLSAVHYLARFLVLVGSGASDMAQLSPLGHRNEETVDKLRGLVGGVRERCVAAVCGAWNKDAENIKMLEDWRRSTEKRDLTRMPATFGAFEDTVLGGMQKILFIPEAMSRPSSEDVVLQPPPKLTTMVKSQFVTTLYRALSGMVENAEKTVKKIEDEWTADANDLTTPDVRASATSIGAGNIDASDRNVRMLLTLSNLSYLRTTTIPALTSTFESHFSTTLTDETATIRDVLSQIDTRLFESYIKPSCAYLTQLISTSIASPSWPPPPNQKPTQSRPYVNEALLSLVLIHTQVSTTASSLTTQILSYLLEHISLTLLTAFKARSSYTLASLMQATLDVEFISQTLSQYTTERAGAMQGQIYQELDKETDADARGKLQGELPGMRTSLKRLREGCKGEFACFRKVRKEGEGGDKRRDGRSASGRQSAGRNASVSSGGGRQSAGGAGGVGNGNMM